MAVPSGLEEAEGLCHVECTTCLLFFTSKTMKGHEQSCSKHVPPPSVLSLRRSQRELVAIHQRVQVLAGRHHLDIMTLQQQYNMLSVATQMRVVAKQRECEHGGWVPAVGGAMCPLCGVLTNRRLYEDDGDVEVEAAPRAVGPSVGHARAYDQLHVGVAGEGSEDDDEDDEDEEFEDESSEDSQPKKKKKN